MVPYEAEASRLQTGWSHRKLNLHDFRLVGPIWGGVLTTSDLSVVCCATSRLTGEQSLFEADPLNASFLVVSTCHLGHERVHLVDGYQRDGTPAPTSPRQPRTKGASLPKNQKRGEELFLELFEKTSRNV